MHEVLLERAAERDLKALSRAVYDRIVSNLKHFPKTHDLPDARKSQGLVATGAFVWAIIASSTKSTIELKL